MKVVIPVGGRGERLESVLGGLPKPLFEINGKSLIERTLSELGNLGISHTDLIIGYKGEQIRQRLGESFNGIQLIYHVDRELKGTMSAIYLAFSEPEECIVLDADNVFNPLILKEVFESSYPNVSAFIPAEGRAGEIITLLDAQGEVVDLKKDLETDQQKYEFTGISKFSRPFIAEMMRLYEQDYPDSVKPYYDYYAFDASRSIPWQGLVYPKDFWTDVDNPGDIAKANKIAMKNDNG